MAYLTDEEQAKLNGIIIRYHSMPRKIQFGFSKSDDTELDKMEQVCNFMRNDVPDLLDLLIRLKS
jgi:hypothetical protein